MTVISVLMGLVKEAVKGGEERGETERGKATMTATTAAMLASRGEILRFIVH